jgi:hypothetical protein
MTTFITMLGLKCWCEDSSIVSYTCDSFVIIVGVYD